MRVTVCTISLLGLAALCSCGGSSSAPRSVGVQATVSGLVPGNQFVLSVEASEFTITANGTFSFEAPYSNPADPTVIATQPDNQTCGIGGGAAPGTNALLLSINCLRNGQFVYVVNSGNNTLSMYSVGADGALTPLNPATAVTGQLPQSITVEPSGLFAYVANASDNSISEFDIGANGALSVDSQGLIQQQPNLAPRAISVDPTGEHAYVLDSGNNTIVPYDIGPNGHLQVGTAVPTGSLPWAVVTPFLNAYITNQDDNTVSQYALASDGTLTPLNPATVASGQAPTGIAIYPARGVVYVANSSDNTISQYSVGAGGVLTAMSPATVTAGTQPVYVQVAPLSPYAYVVNFNAGNAGTISQFAIDANGGLSPIGSPVPTGKGPTMLVLDGMGQFAYVTNSMDSTVSQYAVAADGTLTPLAAATVSTGGQPVGIAVTY